MASAAASRSGKAQAGPQCTSQTYCAPQGGLKDRCAESVESATFALSQQDQEPPRGTDTCSCTTIHPLARFSSTMVQRALRCELAPSLLTRSMASVNVAQASDPRRCTARSSLSLALMLRLGSNKYFWAPSLYSFQLLYLSGTISKYAKSASAA